MLVQRDGEPQFSKDGLWERAGCWPHVLEGVWRLCPWVPDTYRDSLGPPSGQVPQHASSLASLGLEWA